ncbi:uncharacterized protein LOC120343993 [Styela clava]
MKLLYWTVARPVFVSRKAVMANLDSMISVIYKCNLCLFENESIEKLRTHVAETHRNEVLDHGHEASNTENVETTGKNQINIIIEEANFATENSTGVIEMNAASCLESVNEIFTDEIIRRENKSSNKEDTKKHGGRYKALLCTLCNNRLKDEEEMKIHQESHYENNAFKCIKCDYTNSQWIEIKNHMKIHDVQKTNSCAECTMSFASQVALNSHWRFQHLGGKHLCDTCGYEASSKYNLYQHKSQSHPTIYTCYRCNFTCNNEVDLQKHMHSRHESGYICKYCKPTQIFSTQHHLHAHMTQNHLGKKCFICDRCNYVAKLRHHLEKHYLMHTGERPLKCKISGCDFTAREPRHFKQHMVTKHSKPGDLVCKECQFVTSDQNEWDLHISMHHMKVFQCKHCDYQTKNSATLRRHRLAKHVDQDQMRFPCPHCSYRTNFRDSFNKHLLTHDLKNARHKCPICKRDLNTRLDVKNHLLKSHTSDVTSQVQFCNICPYSCTKSSNLKQHKLTHSDVKQYQCEKCNYSSRTLIVLRKHMQKKHQVEAR